MPEAHHLHRPHDGRNEMTTWSPTDQPGVLGSDLLDDAGALVAGDRRQQPHPHVALGQVVVGVAQARRDHRDEQLVLAGPVEVELGDLPLPRRRAQDRRLRLHVALPHAPPLRM